MLRRIPDKIMSKLENITTSTVLVACSVKLTTKDIIEKNFESLGFALKNDSLTLSKENIFPPASFGNVSNENINGKEIIHYDQPKVSKQIYLGDRPIYGDWSNGSFSLWQTRMVYQRSFVQPHGLSINISIHEYDSDTKMWKIVFVINPSLSKLEKNFQQKLLFALSLLNEITGKCDIFPSQTTLEEIASMKFVNWEIFPPGKRDFKSELSYRLSKADNKTRENIMNRASVIENLKPMVYIFGSGLASNYYGALFADDLVLFENLEYGNATYILYDKWEEISKLSRTEILTTQKDYHRIAHNSSWKDQVAHTIKHEIKKRRFKNHSLITN